MYPAPPRSLLARAARFATAASRPCRLRAGRGTRSRGGSPFGPYRLSSRSRPQPRTGRARQIGALRGKPRRPRWRAPVFRPWRPENQSSMRGGSGGFPAVAIKRAAARCGVRRTAAPVASASTAPLPACPPSLRYCAAPSLARGLPASRPAGAGPCLRLRRSALRSCPQPLSAALRAVAAGVRAGPPSAAPAESGGVPSAPPPSGPAGARKRAHVSLCVPLGFFAAVRGGPLRRDVDPPSRPPKGKHSSGYA